MTGICSSTGCQTSQLWYILEHSDLSDFVVLVPEMQTHSDTRNPYGDRMILSGVRRLSQCGCTSDVP